MPFAMEIAIPSQDNPAEIRVFDVHFDYTEHPLDRNYGFCGILVVKHKDEEITAFLSPEFKVYLLTIIQEDLHAHPLSPENIAANDLCMAEVRAASEMFQAWVNTPLEKLASLGKPETHAPIFH